jgi:hypothetical protein
MCKICDNEHLEGLETLDCENCELLTNIPIIEGLTELYCSDCPLLTTISIIKGLEELDCSNCPLLTKIPNIEGLKVLTQPYEDCKYKTSKKMYKLYNNIFYLWNQYRIKKYVNFVILNLYQKEKIKKFVVVKRFIKCNIFF